MPALIVFLLGVITDAATGLGDKLHAAARMVSLGYEDLVPESIRQHLPGAAPSAPRPAAAQAVSTTAATSGGGGHGWLWLVLIAAVLLALYLRPAVTACLTRPSSSPGSTSSHGSAFVRSSFDHRPGGGS